MQLSFYYTFLQTEDFCLLPLLQFLLSLFMRKVHMHHLEMDEIYVCHFNPEF